MDKGSVIGIVVGILLICGSIIINGSLTAYIDPASFLLVVGGTFAATLISERIDRVIAAVRVAKQAFVGRSWDAGKVIPEIIELAAIARRQGILELEGRNIEDPILAKGVRMIIDGMGEDEVRDILVSEMIAMKQRHIRGQKLFRFMGATSPAMGMIGTLIGLVQMLKTLDDPSSIGPAMAVALLTTMYGAILAFLIFNPIAEKLTRRTAEETARMTVVIEGVLSIARGHNAMVIQDRLESLLSPQQRAASEALAAPAGGQIGVGNG
jgi:chemotaxis protein MotA